MTKKLLTGLWRGVAAPMSTLGASATGIRRQAQKDYPMSERELGRLEEGLRNIEKAMDRAEVSRKTLYEKVDNIETTVRLVEQRVHSLEKNFTEVRPTISEFVSWQDRIKGAGMLGKFLWFAGGIILSAAAYVVSHLNLIFAR